MTLYARQQKRWKEQSFGLCGKRQGWDDLREQHWNMYIVIYETDHQPSRGVGLQNMYSLSLIFRTSIPIYDKLLLEILKLDHQ